MEIVNIDFISNTSDYQQYSDKDVSLINTSTVSTPFGSPSDYVEYFINDLNGNLLSANYFEKNYTPINPDPVTGNYTALEIDPEADVKLNGYDRGSVEITYNFFRNIFRSDFTNRFWIKEISGDRTELRISRQDLSNQELQQTFQDFDNQAQLKAYYPDFYLNFGDNNVLIGVNVLFTIQDGEACLLLKLYEPLPDNISLKDTFWIVEQLSDSVKYQVTIDIPAEQIVQTDNLRGPNFNLGLAERVSQTTPLYNFNSLFVTSGSNSSSSLYQQIRSMMDEKGLDINVDYSDFSNFSHFSSVQERIYNFAYKLSLIEKFTADIANLTTNVIGSNAITSGSIYLLQQQINNIIEKFDGYEYYLYYENAPTAWPKSSDFPPYTLYPVTSTQALSWLGNADAGYGMLYSASVYDSNNKDLFLNTIPAYLREDTNNLPYETFLNMVGQHFDNIWIYYKDVSERFNAENRLTKGISKDLVGEALKSMGINLYTNTSISDNLYYSTLGIDPDGSLIAPTGSVSASYYIAYNPTGPYVYIGYTDPNYYVLDYDLKPTIPGNDITLEYYKRIYHNLPYLLKTRGTTRGLRALINCYGIPDTMLKITEFGGSDKLAATPDLVQDRYSLAYQNTGSMNLAMPWAGQDYYYQSAGSSSIVPDTIEFRFKTTGIPDSAHISQSIFEVNRGGTAKTLFGLQLTYNSASAVASSSLQNNGNLVFKLQSGSLGTSYASTVPITLPFFDSEQWWTVMMRRDVGNFAGSNSQTSNTYWVYVKGAAYNEEGNGEITYEASQSITVNVPYEGAPSASCNVNWNTVNTSSLANLFCGYLGGPINQTSSLCPLGTTFQGYFQEFRYWNTPLQESAFDEHVQNSISYRGNTITSSLYELSLRIPLGNNLNVPYLSTASLTLNPKDYQYYQLGFSEVDQNAVLTSYHPSITGSFTVPYTSQIVNGIGSFVSASRPISYGLFSSGSTRTFTPFVIADLVSSPSTGVNQKVNNKLFIPQLNDLPETVLSPYVSVQRFDPDISKNSADLEVGFSPNDLVDADITDQLGYFNIDEYIGKPSDAYETEYVDLNNLRKTYFQKYISKFTLWDFMNLVKFYDNSLFKMIKDFVPARANLSTGIIIKPHILERPKYPRHEPTWEFSNESSGSIDMVIVTGSNPEAMYLNTSFTQSLVTSLGTITSIKTDLSEPFTGEFSGTTIPVTNNGTFTNTEVSSINYPWTSSISTGLAIFTTYSLGALFNNVTGSRRSTRFLETDYSSNIIIPVNSGLITGALALYPSRSANPTYTGLDSIYWPFSDINDYNYYSYARINSRYSGSKVVSLTYNTYSSQSATWGGDQSYGNTAAIDHNSYKLGWVSNIPSVSKNFYDKTTINLKYLVDQDSNVLELSANNTNLFEVQNTFRSGDPVKVSVSNVTVPTNQVALDGLKTIWRGGYSFDPILFRENNEPLSFRFDAPYSSSLTGIGIKAIAENSFGMNMHDNNTTDKVNILNPGVGGDSAKGVYTKFENGIFTPTKPFASKVIAYTDWVTYIKGTNVTTNSKINKEIGNAAVYRGSTPAVYELYNNVVFDKTSDPGFNTEPTADTLNKTSQPYIFKAPRSSQYSVDISIPVIFSGVYQINLNNNIKEGIKFFAILEKASTPTSMDWTYIDATELNVSYKINPNSLYTVQPTYNLVAWKKSNDYIIFSADLKKTGIVLNQDEVLRLRYYLIDISDTLGVNSKVQLGENGFTLFINGFFISQPGIGYSPSVTVTDYLDQNPKAYFQLTDDLSTKTTDYYIKKLQLTQPLFVTGSADTIRFTGNLNEYFLSASTFFPSSSNQDFYTPVVDRFSIQPYDLIRVGPFESLKSKYYTVTKVEPAVTSVTIDTNAFYTASASNLPAHDAYFDNYSTTGRGGATNFAILFVTQSFDINTYFNVGTKFSTTGTTGGTCDVTDVTVLGYAIGNLYTVPSPSYVSYTLAIDKTISTAAFSPATYSISNHGEQITVIPNIDTGSFNLGQTFAILRPKPNETSVILDYKKREGEVSQTMLIPYDASAELKTNVGTIFENLYTQL
jgi:hypothetical protein